jgi:hypothetical protein
VLQVGALGCPCTLGGKCDMPNVCNATMLCDVPPPPTPAPVTSPGAIAGRLTIATLMMCAMTGLW